MSRIIAVVLGLLLVAGLGACAKEEEPVKPDYTPVADSELFRRIEAIPGVVDSEVGFRRSATYGTEYFGPITVEEGADAPAILDRAYAILRQGRFDVGITVRAVQGGKQISSDSFGLTVGTEPNLRERYGPQPGDGSPPASGG